MASDEPSLLSGVAAGLDPRPSSLDHGQGIVAQVGPLVVFIAYVGILVADALGLFHGEAGSVTVLLGVLGPIAGAWARHLGS